MSRRKRFEFRGQAGRHICLSLLGLVWLASFTLAHAADDANLTAARRQLLTGQYTACLRAAEPNVRPGSDNEEWPLLQVQALLAVGRYPEAYTAITNALARQPRSIRL